MDKKEKHKFKKVKTKFYYNVLGDPDNHRIMEEEYYQCEKCGIKKFKI